MKGDLDEYFGAVVVAALLILTAWGNAIAMFIASAIGVVVALVAFRKRMHRGSVLVGLIACVVAGGLAVAITLGLKG